jgi:diguanylate cyclase (GGDEF)-like protein
LFARFIRKQEPEYNPPANTPDQNPTNESNEVGIENVSFIIKEYGRNAFDIEASTEEEIRDVCNKWAMHLQYGAPRPNTPEGESGASQKRDWPGFRQFFSRQRQGEKRYVRKALGDLNQVIWTFINGLKTTIVEDTDADNVAISRLQKMENVVKTGTTEEIRQEVLESVSILSGLIRERQQRQKHQTDTLYSQINDLGGKLQEAREESARDSLTRLFNRSALDFELTRTIDLHKIFGKKACLLMLDLDYFKRVNDTYGHIIGDAVLKQMADILIMAFPRKSDFIARYGGEEFAIIMADTDISIGRQMGERLLKTLRESDIKAGENPIHITSSAGITEVKTGETAAQWMERTDRALYQAKNNGRDRLAIGHLCITESMKP